MPQPQACRPHAGQDVCIPFTNLTIEASSYSEVAPGDHTWPRPLAALHPHGVSTHTDEHNITRVFVVNHSPDGDSVEIFQLLRGSSTLMHERSVRHAVITSINDVHAVRVFFASLFAPLRGSLFHTLLTSPALRFGFFHHA